MAALFPRPQRRRARRRASCSRLEGERRGRCGGSGAERAALGRGLPGLLSASGKRLRIVIDSQRPSSDEEEGGSERGAPAGQPRLRPGPSAYARARRPSTRPRWGRRRRRGGAPAPQRRTLLSLRTTLLLSSLLFVGRAAPSPPPPPPRPPDPTEPEAKRGAAAPVPADARVPSACPPQHYFASKNAEELANASVSLLVRRAESHVHDELLKPAVEIARATSVNYRFGYATEADPPGMLRRFLVDLEAYEWLATVYFVSDRFYGVRRDRHGDAGSMHYILPPPGDGARGEPTWSQIYASPTFAADGQRFLTVGVPVYGRGTAAPAAGAAAAAAGGALPSGLHGLVAVDIELGALAEFFQAATEQLLTPNALIFATEDDGDMVAVSRASGGAASPRPELVAGPGGEPLRAFDNPDAVVRLCWETVHLAGDRGSDTVLLGSFRHGGARFFLARADVREGPSLMWHLFAAIPEDDLVASVKQSTVYSAVANALFLAVALSFSLLLGFCISRPLRSLKQTMEWITRTMAEEPAGPAAPPPAAAGDAEADNEDAASEQSFITTAVATSAGEGEGEEEGEGGTAPRWTPGVSRRGSLAEAGAPVEGAGAPAAPPRPLLEVASLEPEEAEARRALARRGSFAGSDGGSSSASLDVAAINARAAGPGPGPGRARGARGCAAGDGGAGEGPRGSGGSPGVLGLAGMAQAVQQASVTFAGREGPAEEEAAAERAAGPRPPPARAPHAHAGGGGRLPAALAAELATALGAWGRAWGPWAGAPGRASGAWAGRECQEPPLVDARAAAAAALAGRAGQRRGRHAAHLLGLDPRAAPSPPTLPELPQPADPEAGEVGGSVRSSAAGGARRPASKRTLSIAASAASAPETEWEYRSSGTFQTLSRTVLSFMKFVPNSVVRSMLRDNEHARLGMEVRRLTVMFVDIQDFTAITERMRLEKLVVLVTEYFEAVTTVMEEHRATVDKYIGDALMLLFNAPEALAEHEAQACAAALACRRRLAELRHHFRSIGLPPLRSRFGIHTGECLVGNIGSQSRMNYTAVGDAVNLASRCESLNKAYGSSILITADVYERVRERFVCRWLDRAVVKGKSEATDLYELVCAAGDRISPARTQMIADHGRALQALLDRRFEEARDGFASIVARYPRDRPARMMLERARGYARDPATFREAHEWHEK
eukprot:tig00020878_g14877.t1